MRALDDVHAIDLEHAKLSASGGHKWMTCTASAWMELHFPDVNTAYSEEGTRAHRVGSESIENRWTTDRWLEEEKKRCVLEGGVYDIDNAEIEAALARIDELYPTEMLDHVQDYVNFVNDLIENAQEASDVDVLYGVEDRVNFSRYVPQGFGTADFWAYNVSSRVARVVDYKHGKGVPVHVEDNVQTMMYALGVRELLLAKDMHPLIYDITIFQPRIGNVKTWSITDKQLVRWAERVLHPVAEKVWISITLDTLDGVEFNATDAEVCRFCKAKIHCRARADARLAMAQYEKDVAIMTDREVEAVLGQADHLKKWANDLHAWAQERAAKGIKVKGFKLVEGRANRQIPDVERAARLLRFEGFKPEQIYEPRKMLGLTKLEALVHGKAKLTRILGNLIVKPQGKPVLVPDTDAREEFKQDATATAAEFEQAGQ